MCLNCFLTIDSYKVNYKVMSDKSTQNQSTLPESTPKRTRWDMTPLVKHDLNSDNGLKKVYDQTPSRP